MSKSYVLTAILNPDIDGGYVAQIAELPGIISQGETVEESLINIREAADLYLRHAAAEELAALGAHPVIAPIEVNLA